MVRDLLVDELVRDALIYENQTPAVGLLIGAENENGDFSVAHLAETLEESNSDDGKAEGESQSSSSSDEAELPFVLEGKSFKDIKPDSISHHAKQVIRMLPGGLCVLGIYIVESIDSIFTTKFEGTVKNLLLTLNKSLSRNVHYGAELGRNNERIVLHFNPKTKKFHSKVIECLSFKSQETGINFTRLEWSKLECEYDTLFAMHLAKDECGLPLKKHVRVLLNSFQKTFDEARFIINGENPSKDVIYEEPAVRLGLEKNPESDDGLGGGGGDADSNFGDRSANSSPRHGSESESESESNQTIADNSLHILIEKTPGIIRTSGAGEDFVNHLHLHGKIAAVAFVRTGSSTAFAVKAIKQDIIRSLAARMDMHCETLIEEELSETEEGYSKIYHEVPRRVFANLLGSKLRVSDYLLPGEGPKDAVISFRDILSLRLENDIDIIMTMEKPFNLEQLRNKGSMEELMCTINTATVVPTELSHRRTVFWIGIVAILIGLLAIITPLAINLGSQSDKSAKN